MQSCSATNCSYNPVGLQLWILQACQGPRGGLRDKPGKPPDFYHTCYCLSGLSCAQQHSQLCLGPLENALLPTDPLCNVVASRLAAARTHFNDMPSGAS